MEDDDEGAEDVGLDVVDEVDDVIMDFGRTFMSSEEDNVVWFCGAIVGPGFITVLVSVTNGVIVTEDGGGGGVGTGDENRELSEDDNDSYASTLLVKFSAVIVSWFFNSFLAVSKNPKFSSFIIMLFGAFGSGS